MKVNVKSAFKRRSMPLIFLFMGVFVLAVSLAIATTGLHKTAWAAEGNVPSSANENENIVNPQQLPDSSFIYDTPISSLSSADTFYDNQTVQVVGEAVGDMINADMQGDYRWVMLSSEQQGITSTISVYMTASAAERIDTFGRYNTVGTNLQVRGTFHLVCAEHAGVSDIHAEVVSVVDPGSQSPDRFVLKTFIPGAVMILIGVVLMIVFYQLRERQR